MFAYPLGLLALLAVPGVIALHLYRRRFEPRQASGLFLWHVEDRQPVAGRKREPLVRSVSFWCELLAALALALAFSGPRSSCSASEAEHLVVVLDSSASLGAVVEGREVRERALDEVKERIDGLPRGSRVTLVRSGPRPMLVAGPAAFPGEARERLEEWKPLAARHDLQPALALGLELSGGGRVLVLSDHFEPESFPQTVELLSVGEPVDNWAIVHAVRSREAREGGVVVEKAFLSLASYARAPKELTLVVTSAGTEFLRRKVDIGARDRAHLAFELPAGTDLIEVQIDADALALDNKVALVAPAPRTLALHSTLGPELDAALGLSAPGDPNLERWLALVPQSTAAGSLDAAHLALTKGAELGRASWNLAFEPLGAGRKDLIGPFLAERGHRALQGVTLEGLVWSADPELVLPGAPLISAGNLVLLSEERGGGRVLWHINLDPLRSSLQRSPDWPILLANLAELRREELPGPARTNVHIGESLQYRPGAEATRVERKDEAAPLLYKLTGPLGVPEQREREVAALEQVVIDGLEEPGLYELSLGAERVAQFALSFADAAESDLSTALAGRREATLGNAQVEAALSWIEVALLALAAAALILDWFVLRTSARTIPGVS